MLHIQTKQIKDDLTLQIKSDRENLVTMAHFASNLYVDGESYDRMFASFEPIGLFSRIGILTPEEKFITKDGTYDLKGKISFEEQAGLGEHITGRTYSYSIPGEQVVRSSVPILVNGETVGIMYGTIKIETIGEKYNKMADELDAQLFVYDKGTGDYIINTVEGAKGNISSLKTREYNKGYTYENIIEKPNGYSSFIVDNKTKKIVSAEALSRWDSSEKGLIGPGKYIENMEASGLISRHDFYMFELVCRQLEKWAGTEFENVALSCNFTRITLSEENFIDKLLMISNSYSFDKTKIAIEITEDAIEKDRETATKNVVRA